MYSSSTMEKTGTLPDFTVSVEIRWGGEVNWLFNVTINDISVIYVTAHRCAGGLEKNFWTYGRAPNDIAIS